MLSIVNALAFVGLATSIIAEAAQRPSAIWKDPYIAEPTNYTVTRIQKCSFQLTFRRDNVDSSYSFAFLAVYDGQAVEVEPITGGLPIATTGPIFTTSSPTGRYQITDRRVLSVHHFNNACRDGRAPSAFRVRAILPSGYNYENNYRTRPIPVRANEVPAVPGNVRVRKAGQWYTVTWDGVPGATGYFALAAGTYYNSEVGDLPDITTILAGSRGRSASFNNRTESVSVVARGADGVVSRTDRVPEIEVPKE